MALKLIWQPVKIGNVEVKNRVVRSAHGTNFGKGEITDDLIAYHLARAKGGVGLTTLEYCTPHSSSFSNGLRSYDDSIISGYQKLVAAIKPYGMTVFQQLTHGGVMYPGLDGVAWSASATPNPWSGQAPQEMNRDQIAELVDAFAEAVRRCVEGGIQGVEIHFGHGYLVQQFLSPLMNRRVDEYGGSFDNRLRFGREILHAVKKTVPESYPVGIRISDQLAAGGIDAEDAARIVGLLESEGLINFVTGSQGSYYSLPAMLPAMDRPLGSMLPSSSRIVSGARRATRILTPALVRTLEEAEQMLRDDLGDMIVLQRAHIADPDLVRKTREGRVDEIRPCINCNQGCVGGLLSPANLLGCSVNPAVGFEQSLAEQLIVKTAAPRKVLVVGGGPGGMEAARVAALAGHHVVLAEAGPELGGLINIAKLAPHLHALGDFTQWQEHELYRLGVEVRTNTYIEAEDVVRRRPDVVVLATGSEPRMDGVQHALPGEPAQGMEQAHVVSSVDLLTGAVKIAGGTALVFDDTGNYEAVAIAEWLVERGVAVTYATCFPQFAPIVDSWCRAEPALERLYQGQFEVMTRTHLVKVEENRCIVRPLQSTKTKMVAADIVVPVLSREPLNGLYRESADFGAPASIVGDAKAPRDFQAAVREGHLAARAIQ